MNNVTVQLKKESTLRTITGFNKALAISAALSQKRHKVELRGDCRVLYRNEKQ